MAEESCGLGSWTEFDLSALTYPEFLAFFFDRPVVGDDEEYELFRSGIDRFIAKTPANVVDHLRRMCCDLSELTKAYSPEQVEQGLWAVFGAGISCERFLFDPSVDIGARTACVESMYLPFRDVVAKSNLGKTDSFYWMWWDMILHTFPGETPESLDFLPRLVKRQLNVKEFIKAVHAHSEAARAYESLSTDAKQVLEAIHETLLKILDLEHPACQWSALHGLGHSPHPKVHRVVREYLQHHRASLNDEDAECVERCSQGQIQ